MQTTTRNSFARWTATLILTSSLLVSCMEKKTTDANDAYKYWAGTNPPSDLQVINGQYWQSSHWTKEYILYLKFKPTDKWWNDFIKENHLPTDTNKWTKPDDAPNWFQPTDSCVKYGFDDEFDQGSRYFRDTTTGVSYIYEIQL